MTTLEKEKVIIKKSVFLSIFEVISCNHQLSYSINVHVYIKLVAFFSNLLSKLERPLKNKKGISLIEHIYIIFLHFAFFIMSRNLP